MNIVFILHHIIWLFLKQFKKAIAFRDSTWHFTGKNPQYYICYINNAFILQMWIPSQGCSALPVYPSVRPRHLVFQNSKNELCHPQPARKATTTWIVPQKLCLFPMAQCSLLASFTLSYHSIWLVYALLASPSPIPALWLNQFSSGLVKSPPHPPFLVKLTRVGKVSPSSKVTGRMAKLL